MTMELPITAKTWWEFSHEFAVQISSEDKGLCLSQVMFSWTKESSDWLEVKISMHEMKFRYLHSISLFSIKPYSFIKRKQYLLSRSMFLVQNSTKSKIITISWISILSYWHFQGVHCTIGVETSTSANCICWSVGERCAILAISKSTSLSS